MADSDEICMASSDDDLCWVLGEALQHAKQDYQIVYVFMKNGFYWMTGAHKPVQERIARVYPGGRIELGSGENDGITTYPARTY